MTAARSQLLGLFLGAGLVVVTACSPAALSQGEIQTTATGLQEETLTPTSASREVVLTFDGETCQYSGPVSITEGDLTVVLENQTEYVASLWVVRLDQGRSWQDMLEYIGEPGTYVNPPEWSSISRIFKSTSADNPDTTIFTFDEGLYAMCCCTCNEVSGPRGVWPGAALEVKSE